MRFGGFDVLKNIFEVKIQLIIGKSLVARNGEWNFYFYKRTFDVKRIEPSLLFARI